MLTAGLFHPWITQDLQCAHPAPLCKGEASGRALPLYTSEMPAGETDFDHLNTYISV